MLTVEAVEEYLASTGNTLWGQAYDVQDPARRRKAAKWFLGEIAALYDSHYNPLDLDMVEYDARTYGATNESHATDHSVPTDPMPYA